MEPKKANSILDQETSQGSRKFSPMKVWIQLKKLFIYIYNYGRPKCKMCLYYLLYFICFVKICYTNQVRKEKLGDRIAALQQLVAPFGKVTYSDLVFAVY